LAQALGCEVLGLTLSEKQAKLARHNAEKGAVPERAHFLVQDAESFDYLRSRFDAVWTMESSEHFADKRAYFHNVAQTLRSGGKLLLAAWTGSMHSPRVQAVAKAFLCPELWTAEQYQSAIEAAGLRVCKREDLTAKVTRTWEICRAKAQTAAPVVRLLPAAVREFVGGIGTILEAYASGELTYTVMVGEK